MTNFNIIQLESNTTRVKLPVPRDTRSKEQKQQDKYQQYSRIESNITPFITNLSRLKSQLKHAYLYMAFDDLICSEDAQKCMKKISGDNVPNIKTVSEDETSVILEVDLDKVKLNSFKHKGKYLSYFKALKSEPKVFDNDNFSLAYKEISDENLNDDFTERNVIVVLNNLDDVVNKAQHLGSIGLFEEIRLVAEIGVIFGKLIESKSVVEIRNIKFVACAYLENFDDLSEEYGETRGKTKIPTKVSYSEKELRYKPHVCIIDCGINDSFKVTERKKLSYVGADLLDHGTQIASIASSARDLIEGKVEITQEYNILSYKISDGKKENIIEGLVSAIRQYRYKCRIFVLSYNYYYALPPVLLHYLSKRIDSFLQKSEVIVLVSTGNNCDEAIKDAIDHNYLDKNPILFPSNCKNVISTGALLKYDDPQRIIAPYTRYLPYYPDLEHRNEAYYLLKPNIFTFGGGKDVESNQEFFLPSISADNRFVQSHGTSFANALMAYYFLNLMDRYRKVQYVETYKALMLASGQLDILDNREEGSFKVSIGSLKEFESDIKHVLLFDEHEAEINKYRRDQSSQNSEELAFYVDANKVSKIQVFLVHSNDFINNPYTQSLIYFNVRLYEPNASKTISGRYTNFGDRSQWSTFGKCTPIQIAEYELGKQGQKIQSQIGEWKMHVMPMRKNIPTDQDVFIKWGIVIKLIPRRDYEDKVADIYKDVIQKTSNIVKEQDKVEVLQQGHIDIISSDEVPA